MRSGNRNVFPEIRDNSNMLEMGGRKGRSAELQNFISPLLLCGREVCPPDPNGNPRWAVLRSESKPQRSKSPEPGRSMFGVGETVKQGRGKGRPGHRGPSALAPFPPRLSRLLECKASNSARRHPHLQWSPLLPLPAPSVPVVPRCLRAGASRRARTAVKEQRSSENCAG